MLECKPVTTPLESSIQLKLAEILQSPVNQTLFRQMIGSLMYLMIGTRPDIAAAVSIISQFASNPMTLHHQAGKRILRYLKGMINMKLNFSEKLNFGKKLNFEKLNSDKESKLPILIGYSDANWGNDINT